MSEEINKFEITDETNLPALDFSKTDNDLISQLNEMKEMFMDLLKGNQVDCTAGKPEEVTIAFFKDGSTMMLPMSDFDVKVNTIEGMDKIQEEELKLWQPLRELPQEKQDQLDIVIRYSKTGRHLHYIPSVEEIMTETEAIKSQIRERQNQADFHFDQMTSINIEDEPSAETPAS